MATLLYQYDAITKASRNKQLFEFNSFDQVLNKVSYGQGKFSGKLPDYFARLSDGTPASGIVLELITGGVKIKETTSGVNGEWEFTGLDHTKMYDIIAKHPTLEAVISTKRYPKLTLESYPTNVISTVGDVYTRRYIVKGGFAPYAVDVGGSPVTAEINNRLGFINLSATKIATQETYNIVFSSNSGLNTVIQPFIVPAL